jgi:hypothetical protein
MNEHRNRHSETFCSAKCSNFDCDYHASSVPLDTLVQWENFHKVRNCPGYLELVPDGGLG